MSELLIKQYGNPIPLDKAEGMETLKNAFINIRNSITISEIEILQNELNETKIINEKLLLPLQG